MRKGTAVAMMMVGALCIGAEARERIGKFSSEKIWSRQAPLIERSVPAGKREAKFAELRSGLDSLAKSTSAERCRFETDFHASLSAKGDKEAASRMVANRSYEPYAECQTSAQLKAAASRWYTWAGLAAFALGLISLVRGRN